MRSGVERRRRPATTRPGLLVAAVLTALAALPACERSPAPPRYKVVKCTLVSQNVETGELAVSWRGDGGEEPEQTLHGLVTRDSEISINDRLAAIHELRRGDALTLIGYLDPNPPPGTFVVSVAYVERSLPPPPDPDELLRADPAGRLEEREP